VQRFQFRQAIVTVVAAITTLVTVAPASAETTLLVTGTYASAADQLAVDFTMPVGTGRMWMSTYANAGGTAPDCCGPGAPPAIPIGAGGIDSIIRLFDSANVQIGVNDDHDNTLDSLIAAGTWFFFGETIPALPAGNYRLRQDVFSSSLNNGSFALSATSVGELGSVGSYTLTGLSPTAGVTINSFYFGQKQSTSAQPARLVFDSPSDALSVTGTTYLYGNFDIGLSAGSIASGAILDGPISGITSGNGLVTLNGGNVSGFSQRWGNASGQRTVVNHSAGSNNTTAIFLAGISNSDVTYNLSGSGSMFGTSLLVGAEPANDVGARFHQSGGTLDFLIVNVGFGPSTTGPTRVYRLTGGTAMIHQLSVRAGGLFELAGGTLQLTGPTSVATTDSGRFDWLSGTVRFSQFTLDGSAGPHFGPTLALTAGRTLEVTGATTNNTVLTIDGGRLITSTLGGPGAYVLNSGELRITGAGGLAIGAAGPFGNALSVKPAFLLNVTNELVVQNGAYLHLQDGGRVQAGSMTNNAGGMIQLAGPAARLEGSGALNNSGVLTGNGVVNHSLSNLAGGEVSASIAQTLRFTSAASHSNQGLVRLAGGELLFSGAFTNNAAGNIEGRGVLRTGGLTNQGDLALSSGVTDVHGDVVNAPGGRTIISGNADVTFWDDMQNDGALFKVAEGSSATFFGAYGGAGVTGVGDVYFEADVTPGASPALAQFDGNVTLGALSRLAIELGGSTIGSQYDSIAVAGQLSLAGTLDVSLIEGFTPNAGQSFNILDWGGLTGTFTSINLPSLEGLAWNTSQIYSNGILSVESPFLEGDFDENGFVNGADLTAWKTGFGTSGGATHSQGDANADADADGADFLVWQQQFGSGPGAAPTVDTVPEPATLSSLAIAGALLSWRRTRLWQSQRA
jgi:hypothetical protein